MYLSIEQSLFITLKRLQLSDLGGWEFAKIQKPKCFLDKFLLTYLEPVPLLLTYCKTGPSSGNVLIQAEHRSD